MRLRRNRLIECNHRRAIPVTTIEYGTPSSFFAEMWAGGGKLQAERYGIRLPNIRNLRLDGDYREIMENGEVRYEFDGGFSVSVNDGICIYSAPDQEPDYKVVAVYPYGHLVLEVERRFEGGI